MTTDKNKGDKLLYCSFCGKSQHEVRKLIAGPSVFVCDECIALCNDIIKEEAQTGIGAEGEVQGHFQATGVRPKFADRLRSFGVTLPDTMFDPARHYQ